MNNIIFSKLTKKQVINNYKNKDYKKTIDILRTVFTNRCNFSNYLKEYRDNLDGFSYEDFSDVLYMWTARDELKGLLNSNKEILSINYLDILNKDYISTFFSEEEIKTLKVEIKKYFDREINNLLAHNYELGNFNEVVDSLRFNYKSHEDYESKVGLNNCSDYEKKGLALLREISHIYRHIDFNKSEDNTITYYYAMLKNLLSIYKHEDIEYVDRYLLRQSKLGGSLSSIFNDKELLCLFDKEERNTLIKIYADYINRGADTNKKYRGYGFFGNNEYVNSIHILMNVLEIPGNLEEKYSKMKNEYKYSAGDLNKCIYSSLTNKAIKKDSLDEFKNIYNGYKIYLESIAENRKIKQIKDIEDIIEVLIQDDINIDEYFNKSTTLKSEFKQILKFMKENCHELYSRYIKIRNERLDADSSFIVRTMINNDDFSDIDYYLITRYPQDDIKGYLKQTNYNAYIMFCRYMKSIEGQKVISDAKLVQYCKSVQTLAITKKDGATCIVEPTFEEKVSIVNFLKQIGAPITPKNIDCGLRRYYKDKDYGYEKRITL